MRTASASLATMLLLLACGPSGKAVRDPGDEDEDTAEVAPAKVTPPADPGKRPRRPTPGQAAMLGDPRQLDAETAIETDWGATVPVPAGWFVAQGPDLLKLQDPDREITIGVSAIQEDNANVAILAAWKLLDPSFALPVKQSVDLPGRDGWDGATQIAYVTRTEDSRLVLALARKKGDLWHVLTIDGKLAAVDRRGAQTSSIANDLKVPGLEIESYADNPATLDRAHLDRFAALAETIRQQTGVPGVAIAVVHRGKVVFERGFGVRSIRSRKPVKTSTRFLIGSTTKALTSLLVARGVDQGKFGWDSPVTQVLPTFALGDPAVTPQVQMKHTLCACTGMPRNDLEFLFEFAGWSPEQRLGSLAEMQPTTGFGETFQYSNLMVAAGGWAAGHAFSPKDKLAAAYERAMRKQVFEPLRMRHTTFDFRKFNPAEFASPNAQDLDLTFVEMPVAYEQVVAAVAPAGGAWSTVGDLANYMMLELARGKTTRGKTLIGEAALLERRVPQVKIDGESTYGMGLMVTLDHGVTVVHHGGNTLGFTSDLFMLPDQDLGVVVLSNAGGANPFRTAIRQAFLETIFDGRAVAKEQLSTALGVQRAERARERPLIATADAAWIAPLVGTYSAPGLGTITIAQKAGGYQLDAGEWVTALAEKSDRDGTKKLYTTTPPYLGLELVPRERGGVTTLVLEAGQQVYTFTPTGAPAPAPTAVEPAADEPAADEPAAKDE